MSDSGDQLLSFLLYSMLVYPLTSYILSPQRGLPRWKSIVYAMGFLSIVTYGQLKYQASTTGPNYYEMLQVQRNSPIGVIKKSYRTLSLELHPDKSKSPTATDDFRKLNHAFDVITDKEKRREYDRLGENGLKALTHHVIDHKYLLLQIMIYYASSLMFSFLLNLSEKGDAFGIAVLGLAVMLLLELILVVHEWRIPGWIFPQTTPHEIIASLHQIYPAFMHGIRCILAVVRVDRKAVREATLDQLVKATTDLSMRTESIFHRAQEVVDMRAQQGLVSGEESSAEDSQIIDSEVLSHSAFSLPVGSMQDMLGLVRKTVAKKWKAGDKSQDPQTEMDKRIKTSLSARQISLQDNKAWVLLRNLAIYLVARFIFIKGAA